MKEKRSRGVPLAEVRAAVTLARSHADGDGAEWSAAEWERVWSALDDAEQRVVYLVAIVGHTLTEAAAEVGSSRGAVGGVWRRALHRIRAVLPPTANS